MTEEQTAPTKRLLLPVSLRFVNRWISWTGFRLTVEIDLHGDKPTRIGFTFWGWS